MKHSLAKIVVISTVLAFAGTLASLADNDSVTESHRANTSSSASTTPYKILIANKSPDNPTTHDAFPRISVVLQNTSKYQSAFYFSGPMSDYIWNIEYRPSSKSNDSWLHVAPIVMPHPPKDIVQGFQERFSNVEIDLAPGQTATENFTLTNYALNLDGDYRMSLSMELPDCTLRDAKTNMFGLARTKDCTLTTIYSNTIVVRRTATGFITANAVTGK